MLKANTLAIVFANMHDELTGELTASRSMASLPFAGRYRMIDFVLSCLSTSGIQQVVLVTKENYRSLMDHVGSGRAWDLSRKKQGLLIAPPYAEGGNSLYSGKIGALSNALSYVKRSDADNIILCDCNWACNPDLSAFLERHRTSGADVTLACCDYDVSPEMATFSVSVKTEDDRVTDIKMGVPLSRTVRQRLSMNMFVFERTALISLLEQTADAGTGSFGLENALLKNSIGKLDVRCFLHDGYARLIYGLKSYFDTSLELLNPETRKQIFRPDSPIYTKVRDDAPVRYGLNSSVSNSLIADGCIIDGTVINSVLFRGVKVEAGATVRNSVLLQDTLIQRQSDVSHVVTDKNVVICEDMIMKGAASYPLYIAKNTVVK